MNLNLLNILTHSREDLGNIKHLLTKVLKWNYTRNYETSVFYQDSRIIRYKYNVKSIFLWFHRRIIHGHLYEIILSIFLSPFDIFRCVDVAGLLVIIIYIINYILSSICVRLINTNFGIKHKNVL